ncbi:GDSL-type esterase/lipase family protein [Frankia sp. AgB32]|uniref:GDSL-type esterase/lipase family protein n=1 Tax=Frankia sp. AgB32 TaxID=631119 RepID=UPI00200E5340|nr:GDSL-type esterase/lipase family protein [Frankia sp. AgB32]MCK9896978.1 GDSL-type esterase/lipase family protein [Frankia sp. AgB32]
MVDYTLPSLSVNPPDVWGQTLITAFGAFDSAVEAPRAVLGLRAWRAALANRWYAPARIVAVGSSTTAGVAATAIDRRYVNRLGDLLHASHNPPGVAGGAHIAAVDSGWTLTGTNSTNALGLSLQSVTLAAGATMSRTVNPCTGFTVLFEQGPGAGQFTVAVDGGSAVSVTPDTTGTANRHDGTYSTPTVTSGSHSILITAVGACVISGVYAHQGDLTGGVQIYQSGRSGAVTNDFVANLSVPTRIAQLAAGLVILMTGSNEYQSGVSPTAFATALTTLIGNIRATVNPVPSMLLVGTYRRLDVTAPAYPWASYLQAMRDMAADDPANLAYVDISGVYPTSQSVDLYDLIGSDSVHQTDRGHAMMADLIHTAMRSPRLAGMRVINQATVSPDTVSGLVGWWRADALGLADNTAVSSWAPSAGLQSAPLTQSGTNRPVLRTGILNSLPVVRFSAASSQSLDTGAWGTSYTVPVTVVTVARFTSVAVAANLWSGRSGVFAYAGISPTLFQVGAGAAGELSARETPDVDAWHVIAVVYNGASTTVHWDSRPFTTRGTTGTGGSAAMPGLRLGTNSTAAANYLTGDIAEFALYNRALAATEVSQVKAWLAAKYALVIA